MGKSSYGPVRRYSKDFRCPVCGGCDQDARGQGERCHGFLSSDEKYAHCSREEHAGHAPFDASSGCWAHVLAGPCKCGVAHGAAVDRPPARASPPRGRSPLGPVVATYDYVDERGELLYQVTRHEPKTFRQRRPDGRGGWLRNLTGVRLVPYRLPELLASDAEESPVFLCEGEKDVDHVRALGLVATTAPMGANRWPEEFNAHFAGRSVYVLPDNDEKGRSYARSAAASLSGTAAFVAVVELPDLPPKGDASDWIASQSDACDVGGTLLSLAADAAEWSDGVIEPLGAPEDEDRIVRDPIGDCDPAAFHGPLGALALATQAETEANPVFVLAHLLAFFGAAVGRGPHFVVGGTWHHCNLYVGLIGPSGLGRKGVAGDVAFRTWERIDPDFCEQNITDGLNSGAGLLYELRDGSEKVGKNGVTFDEGVTDKRRVFLEGELASVLKQGHRESDPLTEYLRKFWDGNRRVRSKVKGDPLTVSEAHLSIVGHCTPQDLETHLTENDKANGTGNRFLWLFGVRSKVLESGGDIFPVLDLAGELVGRVQEAVLWARETSPRLTRDRAAEAAWAPRYRRFDRELPPGKLGNLFIRAAPIVIRLASIYALADGTAVIGLPHLDAALALWEHAARSLRFLFDHDADTNSERILAALAAAPEGLTKTQITVDVFRRNIDAKTLNGKLERLLAFRRILLSERSPAHGGPKASVYKLNIW